MMQTYCITWLLCVTPLAPKGVMDEGNQSKFEAYAACCAVSNKSFVSDSGGLCLLPASMKVWQAKLLGARKVRFLHTSFFKNLFN